MKKKTTIEHYHCEKCKMTHPTSNLILQDNSMEWIPTGTEFMLSCGTCLAEQKSYKLNRDFHVVRERIFKGQEKECVWKFF